MSELNSIGGDLRSLGVKSRLDQGANPSQPSQAVVDGFETAIFASQNQRSIRDQAVAIEASAAVQSRGSVATIAEVLREVTLLSNEFSKLRKTERSGDHASEIRAIREQADSMRDAADAELGGSIARNLTQMVGAGFGAKYSRDAAAKQQDPHAAPIGEGTRMGIACKSNAATTMSQGLGGMAAAPADRVKAEYNAEAKDDEARKTRENYAGTSTDESRNAAQETLRQALELMKSMQSATYQVNSKILAGA